MNLTQLAHLIVTVLAIIAIVVLDLNHDITGETAVVVIVAAAGISAPALSQLSDKDK